MEKFNIDASGCWVWDGHKNDVGYPMIWLDGKAVRAHREMYKIFNGELTDDAVAATIKSFEDRIRNDNYGPEGLGYIPELAMKNPEELVYSLPEEAPYNLGFNHLVDELENALNPNSGLPQELRLTPEGLSGLSMEEAIRKVHGINQFRDAKSQKANLRFQQAEGIPIHKEYDTGYRWLEYKHPEVDDTTPEGWYIRDMDDNLYAAYNEEGPIGRQWGKTPEEALRAAKKEANRPTLESWLQQEGDTMGHCVGGYCDAVEEGNTRILSLRDNEGKSRVTIELQLKKEPRPHVQDLLDDNLIPQELMNELVKDYGPGGIGWSAKIAKDPRYQELLDKLYPDNPEWAINQVKGPGNRKPRKEDMPYIQDFIKESGYDIAGDQKFADMINLYGWDGENYFPDKYVTKDEAIQMIRQYESDPQRLEHLKSFDRPVNPSLDSWIEHLEKELGQYGE
jgi:hypothetical protein